MGQGAACFVAILILGLALLLPSASAHPATNGREIEALVLQDETSDIQIFLSGYDLGLFYIAESYVPPFGDGLYFHTILFGPYPGTPPGYEFTVVFTMTTESGETVVRTMSTTDGEVFETDFDILETTPVPGRTTPEDMMVVDRAFFGYAGTGLGPGDVIKSFVVESFVDGEIRDRAPGGIYPPGMDGQQEVEDGDSEQVVPAYELTGPVKYASASFEPKGETDEWNATITSLLTEAAQHVHLEIPEWSYLDPATSGWEFAVDGASGGEVEPNGTFEASFRATPMPDANGSVPLRHLNVTTDVGGRLGFVLEATDDGVNIIPEAEAGDLPSSTTLTIEEVPTPAPGMVVTIVVVLAAAMVAGQRNFRTHR